MPDTAADECTVTASCEPGDHTYSWPCNRARGDELDPPTRED